MIRSFAASLLITVSFFSPSTHAIDVACSPKSEERALRVWNECQRRQPRSPKAWLDLESAKGEIEFHIRSNQLGKLADYLGCDADDIAPQSPACKSDLPEIKKSTLEKLSARLAKRAPGETRKWLEHGPAGEYSVLCELPASVPSIHHRPIDIPPCKAEGYPLIELRKGPEGVSISGVSLEKIPF